MATSPLGSESSIGATQRVPFRYTPRSHRSSPRRRRLTTDSNRPRRITEVLEAIARGEAGSSDQLLPLVYTELRRLAEYRMARERPGQTLPPTALVHEVYLRLLGNAGEYWNSRGHFFGAAAEAMRRILVERARAKARLKRGGAYHRTTLEEEYGAEGLEPEAVLDLDRALLRLEQLDPQMAKVVKLRYFAGFTVVETAEVLDISERSVNRHWTAARAWLLDALRHGPPTLSPSDS